MKLSDLTQNQEAIIKNIECSDDLKQRLYSFGIIKGTPIVVEAVSLAKNTMEINVDDTYIGLRVDEAKQIEVELI